MKVQKGPTILFSSVAWQKQWALVRSCKIEISWFGYCMPEDKMKELGIDAHFYVEDIYVVDQECTGVKSDMLPNAVSNLCIKLKDEGKDPSRLKLWGHSHVNMDTGFSGTDEATIETLQLEPLISIVLNKRGDVNIRVDQWKPWRHSFACGYEVEEIQLIDSAWGKDMVKAHVSKPVMKYSGTTFPKKVGKGTSITKSSSMSWGDQWDLDYMWSSAQHNKEIKKLAEGDYVELESRASTEDQFGDADIIEQALFDLDLPDEIAFLEELFISGQLTINDLLDLYLAFHQEPEGDNVAAVQSLLSEMLEESIEEDSSVYTNPSEDPFHVDENPSSITSNKAAKAVVA